MSKSAQIWLSYYKQGDDLDQCIVRDENNKIDSRATLENHINLLQMSIDCLKNIINELPLVNDIELNGNTHYIGITGDERIINNLIEKNLVFEDDFSDEEGSENGTPNITEVNSDNEEIKEQEE